MLKILPNIRFYMMYIFLYAALQITSSFDFSSPLTKYLHLVMTQLNFEI